MAPLSGVAAEQRPGDRHDGDDVLAGGLRRQHEVMAGHVERGEVPGLVAAVARGDEVHVDAIGALEARRLAAGGAGHDLPHLVDDQAGRGRRGDDPHRGVPAAARRTGRRAPARAGRPTGPASTPMAHSTTPCPPSARSPPATCSPSPPATASRSPSPAGSPYAEAMDDPAISTGPPAPGGNVEPDAWLARMSEIPLVHQPGRGWRYPTCPPTSWACSSPALGAAPRVVPPRAGLRAPRHGGHAVQRGARPRPLRRRLRRRPRRRRGLVVWDPADGQWSMTPAFPSGGGGLVSTARRLPPLRPDAARWRPGRRR